MLGVPGSPSGAFCGQCSEAARPGESEPMAELTVRCPKCRQWIATGVGGAAPTATENVLQGNIIQCPHCQTQFRWHARHAVPAGEELPE